jgi:4-diphosphocytidyl-2-C-methyl-D-erythritol kinase
VAPAKVNWTLEVLGKRPDGYHEIKSVMQTIDLCDEISVEKSDRTTLAAEGYEPDDDDLTLRAARALEEATRRELPVAIRLVKRIPVAAGLGGGSSDAVAVLRALDRLYGLGMSREELAAVGAKVGSDVPFFVYGGTALVEGRGERVTPLPDMMETWLVVVLWPFPDEVTEHWWPTDTLPIIPRSKKKVPPFPMAEKTERMYGSLSADDFSHGSATDELISLVRRGRTLDSRLVQNGFEKAVFRAFSHLNAAQYYLFDAGASSVHVAGSGPSLFTVAGSENEARKIAHEAEDGVMRVWVGRTLRAEEATRVE